MRCFHFILLVTLSFLAPVAIAEELILNNGDRIKGQLLRLENRSLHWQSDNFGLLKVDVAKVTTFNSERLVKISGHSGPCAIWFNEGKQLRYSCADSSDKDLQVSTVAVIEPYQQFNQRGMELSGKVGFAGVMSRGNKEEDDWDLDVALQAKHGDYRHNTEAHYDNTNKLSQDYSTEDYKLAYQLDWFFQEQWFLYGDINTAVEESKNIDSRQGVGIGFGYQVFQQQSASLSLESGLSYIDERQGGNTAAEHSGERLNWQWRLDLKYPLLFSTALFHKHTLNYSLQQSDDWELVTETGLHFPLGLGLSSDLKLKYSYDNLPAAGASRKDSTVVVGLAYKW